MDIQTIKLDLITWLSQLRDPSVLQQIKSLKEKGSESLSKAQEQLLDERIKFMKENPGEELDWEEVSKEMDLHFGS